MKRIILQTLIIVSLILITGFNSGQVIKVSANITRGVLKPDPEYTFISSVLEVCTYKQGLPEFTATGEAIINNLKNKGSNYDWSKLYAPPERNERIIVVNNEGRHFTPPDISSGR